MIPTRANGALDMKGVAYDQKLDYLFNRVAHRQQEEGSYL